ncbi:unnamed protein product [Clonostachys rosea f. rosea IK726]|uniref:Uncharacterized protein n=1 Tax=Clonostachys rosea f. rosea IK726 TaxID=1349383 RepID=A0ACA9UPV7_BIOOC|nr:unnamed protein product [Clonostachys rosea f. rosea IK726]
MSSAAAAQPTISAWGETFPLVDPGAKLAIPTCIALILGVATFIRAIRGIKTSKIPLLNPPKGFDLTNWDARKNFGRRSGELMQEGLTKYKGQMFKVMTESGEITIVPSALANDIRNEPNLSFMKAIAEDFHSHLPGFEAFGGGTRSDALIQTMARKQLTKSLMYMLTVFVDKVTEPLSEETNFATGLHFGKSPEWKAFTIYPEILDIVARISSRVFLGPAVCRNQDWLDITKSYTLEAFSAATSLREYPNWLRNLVHWFHPGCTALRVKGAKAKEIITPVIEERRKAREESAARGEPPTFYNDAIEWLEEESKGVSYDAAVTQLSLSMAAIHTTSDLLTETLLRLARRPGLVEELRKEITDVLQAEGWKKTSLYNMKLLDSVIKESQRLRPISMVSMTRKAVGDVKLPNGNIIPKGARTAILTDKHWDSGIYANADEFDPYRFQRQRGTETDNTAHLVSTGPASLGFGHGQHACPGRFFAANEIKVALCHLIVKYDWKVADDATPEPEPLRYSFSLQVDPSAQLYVRRRPTAGLDIDSI